VESNKLIITRHGSHIVTTLFNDFDLVQVNIEEEASRSILGNIYLGKVKNIIKNINAAFVEIANKQICYMSLERQSATVKAGDEVIVQVSKEDVKTKAPVVTTSFGITGKYLVLVHGKPTTGVSGKIEHAGKPRLRKLIKPLIGKDYGFIIRTNAEDAADGQILNEADVLIKAYDKLTEQGKYRTCFSLIYEALPAYIAAIRDGFAGETSRIVTDDMALHAQIQRYLAEYQAEDLDKLMLYQDEFSLNRLYGIRTKIMEAYKERVWLKSGASLVIQPTESLVAIDVNTGKAIHGKKDAQKTFFNVNVEAAKEIARQVRLRNLSGIILVDFINMESKDDKAELVRLLREYVRYDPIKTTVVDMTALDLVEMTRKKVRKPLYEQYRLVIE